jgi:hypothetical protein
MIWSQRHSFVTTARPKHSLNRNHKFVPLALTTSVFAFADVDSDGSADMEIILLGMGRHIMTAADFLL